MSKFIRLVYAVLNHEGIDTSEMSNDEAIAKFKELQRQTGGKSGEKEGTPAENRKINDYVKTKEKTLENEGYDVSKMTKEEINQKYSELEKPLKPTLAEKQNLKDIGIENDFFNGDIENIIKKRNGITKNWKETGYLFSDGSQIDLSGKRWGGSGGKRDEDHRDVFEEEDFNDNSKDNTDAMIELMKKGNIRVSPEYPNINLQKEPTTAQYIQIENMIKTLNGKGFSVEIDNEKGYSIGTLDYDGYVNPKQVIEDMKYYFKTGKIEKY